MKPTTCFLLSCIFLFTGSVESKNSTPASPGITLQADFPDDVTYLFLFRRIAQHNALAASMEERGRSGATVRSRVRRDLGLTSSQARALAAVASDCLKQLDEVDKQISEVVAQVRAQTPPGGRPEIPPRLDALHMERQQVLVNARARLQAELKIENSNAFDLRVKSIMWPLMKRAPISRPATAGRH